MLHPHAFFELLRFHLERDVKRPHVALFVLLKRKVIVLFWSLFRSHVLCQKDDCICVLLYLSALSQICGSWWDSSSCGLSIELCKCYHQRSCGLRELMQCHADLRDGTVSVFRSGLMDKLQIVDKYHFGLHPDGLRSNPPNALTSGRADE